MIALASFALLRPALRPRPCVMMSVEPDRSPAPQMAAGLQPSADRTGELYRRMETILRAAEKGPRAAMARAINSRWFDLEPAALVENVLVATGLDFEAATSLVELAEEEAELTLSPAAYAATMRLGEAEEKHVEMLALLARARGLGVEPSAGMLRLSMKAAAALGDWGAVSRLFAELAHMDAEAAARLEAYGAPETLDALPDVDEKKIVGDAAADTVSLSLALQAHCERGDGKAAVATIRELAAQGASPDEAAMKSVVELAKAGSPAPLLTALTPTALVAFLGGATERGRFEALASVRDTVDEARRAAPYAVAALLAAALVAALTVVAVNAPGLIDGVATEAPAPLPGFEDLMDFQ